MIAIRGGLVLAGAASGAAPADLLIDGSRIREIGPPGLPAPAEATVLDAAGRLLMPGLVNAHTHSHYCFGKGLGDRWTLEMLLHAAPGLTGGLGVEELHCSTLLCAMEMVRKGCTGAYDLVIQAPAPSPEVTAAIGEAYRKVGIRATVAFQMADTTFWQSVPGLLDAIPEPLRGSVQRIAATPAETSLAACRKVLDAWPVPGGDIRPALAPTIPMLCSDGFLAGACALSREHGIGLHTHVAESKVQARTALRRYGTSLTAHLDRLGYLGPNFTAAHAVWLDAEDILRLAANGCSVAHNPESNLRLGNGIAPVRAMADAGISIGIGTDASTCSDQLNMFEAMRLAALAARASGPDPEGWLGLREVFEMATRGGARACGLDSAGRLAPGERADIVFLDLDHLNYVPLNDPLQQVVACENGAAVESVMAGGRLILDHGRFTGVDEAAVIRAARDTAARLTRINQDRRNELAAIAPIVSQFCVGLAREPHPVNRYIG